MDSQHELLRLLRPTEKLQIQLPKKMHLMLHSQMKYQELSFIHNEFAYAALSCCTLLLHSQLLRPVTSFVHSPVTMSAPIVSSWSSLTKHLDCLLDYNEYCKVYKSLWYVWQVHKIGILCIIQHTNATLVPFSNDRFDNRLSWPKGPETFQYVLDGKMCSTFKEYYEAKKKYNIRESICQDTTKWWLNGHLLCNTTDQWSTRGLETMTQTLNYLLANDIERLQEYIGPIDGPKAFLINRRDFPQFLRDRTLTAHTAFVPRLPDGSLDKSKWPKEMPLHYSSADAKSSTDERCTILSFYGSDLFADKLWEPPEYWLARLGSHFSSELGSHILHRPFDGQGQTAIKASLGPKWPQGPKIPKAVFRGTLTGLYMDLRNVRLRLVKESMENPEKLDAGLTSWSPRDRISTNADGLTTVSYNGKPDWLTFVKPMSPWAQAHYATIIYVPGHVASSRLYWHLECQKACGCQIEILNDSSCISPLFYA